MKIRKTLEKKFKKELNELKKEFLVLLKQELPDKFFIKGSRIEVDFAEMRSGDVAVKVYLVKSTTHSPKLIYKKYVDLGTAKIEDIYNLYEVILKNLSTI